MKVSISKLQKLIRNIEYWDVISKDIDDRWSEDLGNAEIEAEWDKAYNEYWNAINEMVAYIVEITDIEKMVATKMAIHKRNEILAIVEKAK